MKKRLLGSTAFILLCHGLHAQQVQQDSTRVQKLDEVVVSDSRFQLKRENSGKTVIKITAKELEQNQGRSVAELINAKSGFEVNGSRSYAGQNISVFARGGNNRQVLVLVDGIQVSDPSNVNAEYDLRLLNTNQIESIEIVKGASSTLYGNSAATAVINITTKSAKQEGTSIQIQSIIGTNQSQEDQSYNLSDFSNTVTLMAKEGKLSILASGGHQYTDGLSAAIGTEEDAFSRLDGNVKLGYQFTDRLTIAASAFYNKLNSDFDNGFPIQDADFSFTSEQSRFGLSSTYNYGKGSLHLNAAFNQISRSFESSFPSAFDSESITFDLFNKYTFSNKWYIIGGINVIDHTTRFTEEAVATTIDPYTNLVYISDFGLNINAGIRLNNHSEYGSNVIYNLNPSYTIKTGQGYVKLLGSYATSFIAPNLSQLFGPFGPNPNLNPEENTTIEGGVAYRPSEKLRVSALYFNREENNRIDFVTINPDTFESQYQNLAETVKFNGVEVELQAELFKNMNLTANYTYTDSDNGLAVRIPQNKINGTLGYTFNSKAFISMSYQYVSERADRDFASFPTGPLNLEAFSLLNIYGKYEISENVSMFLGLDNIFNTNYTEVFGFTTRGRNARLGLNFNF